MQQKLNKQFKRLLHSYWQTFQHIRAISPCVFLQMQTHSHGDIYFAADSDDSAIRCAFISATQCIFAQMYDLMAANAHYTN